MQKLIQRFVPLVFFFGFICLLDTVAAGEIHVVDTPSAAAWNHLLAKMGFPAEVVSLEEALAAKTKPLLILADDFQLPEGRELETLQKLQSFVGGGGRIMAVGRAGYEAGKFWLTPLLRVGGSRHAYSPGGLYNYKTGNPPYDREAFKTRARRIMQDGADGLWFYSFIQMKLPLFSPKQAQRANIPDFEQTAGEVMRRLEQWQKPDRDSIPPIGCPELFKGMWVRDWMLTRNAGMDVEAIVDACHGMGCNWIMFGFESRFHGVRAYPSDVAVVPGHPEHLDKAKKAVADGTYKLGTNLGPVQEDWLARMVERCREHDMGVWIGLPVRPRGVFYEYYPQDQGLNAQGKPDSCPIKLSQRLFAHNARWVEEVLKKFPHINGVVLDEPVHFVHHDRTKSKHDCFCSTCRSAYFVRYGEPLQPSTAYEGKLRTPQYQEFVEDCWVDLVRRYALLLHRVRPDAVLAVGNYFSDNNRDLYDKLADAEVDLLLPEFGGGGSGMPLVWRHSLRRFEFFELCDKTRPAASIPVWGEAVKTKLYRDAQVLAWVNDGHYNYPGVVKANRGRTAYLSFDPTVIERSKALEILPGIINDMK